MVTWNPDTYGLYNAERTRPARDLLASLPPLPKHGAVWDLGCGAGAQAALLAQVSRSHPLHGLDTAPEMVAKAKELGAYTTVSLGDIPTHNLGVDNALLFANASLNWVPDHATLLPYLLDTLAPTGVLAFQVPIQHDAPSHALARQVAHALDPDAFPTTAAQPHVLDAQAYCRLLAPLATPFVWSTTYMQRLAPVAEGHPVRHFTQATYLLPYLYHFEKANRVDAFVAQYDAALDAAYGADAEGYVWFPFSRLFVVAQKHPATR